MTENEAIEKLHAYLECESRRAKIVSCNESCDDCELCYMQGTCAEHIASVETAIQALEEVQQYRQIGKISTCKNAVEICKAMIERGIDPDNIAEYIKFEDNLVQRGYDLKKLIEMMEEHKQYQEIGTVEECREAVEKQTAKKPDYEGDGYSDGQLVYDTWICPCCGKRYEVDYDDYDYCENCGQHIDWSDDDETD